MMLSTTSVAIDRPIGFVGVGQMLIAGQRKCYRLSPVQPDWAIFLKFLATKFLAKEDQMIENFWAILKNLTFM